MKYDLPAAIDFVKEHTDSDEEYTDLKLEVKENKKATINDQTITTKNHGISDIINKFSSLTKILNITTQRFRTIAKMA